MAERTCTAKTKAGNRCKAAPLKDADRCLAHADAKTRESAGFVADNGKQGRKPNPRPHDVLRQRVEADIDRWIEPYEQGLEATRAVVVGTGPKARTEIVPDFSTRMAAADKVLDRVYGKPTQAHDVKVEESSELDRQIENLLAEMEDLDGEPSRNGHR